MSLLVVRPVFHRVTALVDIVLRRPSEEHAAAEEARWRTQVQAMATEERTRRDRKMHDSPTATLSGLVLSANSMPAWGRRGPSPPAAR
ncbi:MULTISPECIES: hypothetical protein [unclassified Actinomadura]|uniref:hypothetical protein n=1 Tax=unclassified Actinomadura TaxID=2626254 RepID=UPI00135C09B5|nr:hypothetical protein [Actinomadura sp. K4S16]